MLRTTRSLAVAASALLLALLGVLASAIAVPEPGVSVTIDGSMVTGVVPGSPAWRDGIRAGQPIVELADASQPGGWQLLVQDGNLRRGTAVVSELSRLRSTIPLAVMGAGIVLAALLLVVRSDAVGLALVPIGLAAASLPLLLTGSLRDAVLGGCGMFLLGGLSVGAATRVRRVTMLAIGVGVVLAGLWLASVLWLSAAFDAIDASRFPAAMAFGAWGGWHAVERKRLASWLMAPGGPGLFDLLYVPAIAAIVTAGIIFLALPLWLAAVIGLGALVAYPFSRRAAKAAVERLVVGRLRRDAEIRAIEEERGRLAREIHDTPLQALSAVIRRLDEVPGVESETSALREVAGQLREVATTLHPPVLEDLGLAAALTDLGDQLAAAHPEWSIRVEVDDLTTQAQRTDRLVEIAAYRIAQEAAANAIRHSHGRCLSIVASIATDLVDLTISDDGTGISDVAVASARRSGHFGLDSMRERAATVGARLDVRNDTPGVRVRLAWERSE